ncbi:hypothetical protein Q8A73_010175 [Channa argus]|nr:hypothetical protein Q8A73_010175 [Channa argus]
MAHPTVFHRRGSNTGSGSGSALSTPANPVVNNSHVSVDDYQPPLLIQCQPPAGSSSPGPHHPPPHSLNLHCQPQPTQSTGAQMKKKSGFQITIGSNPMTTTNVSMIQQHQNVNSNIAMVNTTTTAAAVVSASGGVALSSGMQGRVGSAVIQPVSAPVTAVATAPVSSTPVQPASALATVVAATSSRFRVVKLDSSSEPFKKGRWTCTEFYDKETPASAQSSSASDTGSLSMRQFVSDSITGASERESTSGSSTATSSIPSHVGVTGLGQQPQNVPGHLDCQQQKPQSLPTLIQNPVLGTQLSASVHQSQVSAPSVPPPNLQSDPQAQPQAHNTGNTGRMPPQGVPHSQPSSVTLPHDHSSAQSLTHAAKASALYASLPTFTTTQLQDAQRLLMQHHSVLLGQPKSSSGEAGSGSSTGQGQEAEGNTTASALTASVSLKAVDGEEDGSSGASVVAIDNKIEQAMDLVKSHLMYAVREEVEVLKEQIKELIERNSQLEQENNLLKTLASPEQMAQFQAQVQTGSPPAPATVATPGPPSTTTLAQPTLHSSGPSA